ncbi:hypothetical protein BM530_20595, partial [Clostridioides difficile]
MIIRDLVIKGLTTITLITVILIIILISENKRSGNQSDEKEVNAELTSSVVKANTDNETKNK